MTANYARSVLPALQKRRVRERRKAKNSRSTSGPSLRSSNPPPRLTRRHNDDTKYYIGPHAEAQTPQFQRHSYSSFPASRPASMDRLRLVEDQKRDAGAHDGVDERAEQIGPHLAA